MVAIVLLPSVVIVRFFALKLSRRTGSFDVAEQLWFVSRLMRDQCVPVAATLTGAAAADPVPVAAAAAIAAAAASAAATIAGDRQ